MTDLAGQQASVPRWHRRLLPGELLEASGAARRSARDWLVDSAVFAAAVARRLIALVAGDPEAGARQESARERLDGLAAREREVALAVGRGLANAEIAAELYMSIATVKAHVSRLLTKLGVENRVQIALLVQETQR